MRRDMSKKLCERPRIVDGWGCGDKYGRCKGKIRVNDLEIVEDEEGNETLDVDDSGRSRQAMSRGRGEKVLGENLAPLYRYLESQVNRPWDKVYSDIRENVRFDSATQLHILQHMKGYVAGSDGEHKDTLVEKDGRIYKHASHFYSFRNADMELKKGELFVHPRTKILSRYKKDPKPRHYRPTKDDVKKIDERTYFCKIDGIWHEVIYERKLFFDDPFNFKPSFHSRFNNREAVGHPNNFCYGEAPKHEIRQLPKNILKQEGLKNNGSA